jgi:acetyl-CoA C-acetyltransferase
MAVLSLEASGFAQPGQGIEFAKSAGIGIDGQLPMSTMGGLKARGHAVGSSGCYQVAEIVLQLRGEAGEMNQVKNPKIGLTSSFGGAATSVYTHVIGI